MVIEMAKRVDLPSCNHVLSFSEMLPLALVRPSHVITLSGGDELLNLITSHSEYELSGETSKDYDWSSIERQVVLRYIQNKPRIQFNKDAMIHYVYQEDFNLHNQIKAIDESQVSAYLYM